MTAFLAAFDPRRAARVNLPPAHSEPAKAEPDARPEQPVLTAVIVNYNAWDETAALVSTLAGSPEVQTGFCELVVVDNASSGEVPGILRDPPRGVRFLPRRDNGGFAVGVNAGWHAARSPWLLLLNPDVTVPDGWLGRMLARVRRLEALAAEAGTPGIVGFALLNPDGSRQPSVGVFPSLRRAAVEQLIPRSRRKYQAVWRTKPGPVDWLTGACLLVHGRLMEATGGLDEDFFLYYEEVALCRSAQRLGYRVEYDASIEVVHHKPLQNRPVTPRMRVITRHSKLLYFLKHRPRWEFRVLCAVVATEARFRGAWARWRGRTEDARSWRCVSRVERDLRRGIPLVGTAVLALANSVVETTGDRDREAESLPPNSAWEETRAGRGA